MKIDIRALKLSLYFLFILIIIKIYPYPNQFYLLYPAVVICEYSSHETLDSFKKRTFGFIKGGIFGMILALYVGITPFTVVTALIIIVIISEHIGSSFLVPTLTTFLPTVMKSTHIKYLEVKVQHYLIIMLLCIIIDYTINRVFKIPKEKLHI